MRILLVVSSCFHTNMDNFISSNIGQNNFSNTSVPVPANKIYPKKLLVILSLAFILIAVISVFLFKYLRDRRNTNLVATTTVQQGDVTRGLERNPTKSTLAQEVYVNLSGYIDGHKGRIEEGTGFNASEEDKSKLEKIRQMIKDNIKASNSSILLEARGKNNRVLMEQPLVIDRNPGIFYADLLLPINTNSIVLRERAGQILDRVYVEDREPEIRISSYPKTVGSTDKFQVDVELLPEGKVYTFYSLSLKNTKDGSIKGISYRSDVSGKITENVDLNGYPFTATDSWVIEAVVHSLFYSKTIVSEPILITLSSENIEVKIGGRDKITRKSGESDYIDWSHIFYGVDVTSGLKDLCKKGRCFELIWSGEGVQFNESFRELKPASSVNTQINGLKCMFQGSGKQSIHLEVKENGKIIGEDTYNYTVSGIGTEPSICQINDY